MTKKTTKLISYLSILLFITAFLVLIMCLNTTSKSENVFSDVNSLVIVLSSSLEKLKKSLIENIIPKIENDAIKKKFKKLLILIDENKMVFNDCTSTLNGDNLNKLELIINDIDEILNKIKISESKAYRNMSKKVNGRVINYLNDTNEYVLDVHRTIEAIQKQMF